MENPNGRICTYIMLWPNITIDLDKPCKPLRVNKFAIDKDDLLLDITQVNDIATYITGGLFCLFCKQGDEEVGLRKREHTYSCPNGLKRQVRGQHITELAVSEL